MFGVEKYCRLFGHFTIRASYQVPFHPGGPSWSISISIILPMPIHLQNSDCWDSSLLQYSKWGPLDSIPGPSCLWIRYVPRGFLTSWKFSWQTITLFCDIWVAPSLQHHSAHCKMCYPPSWDKPLLLCCLYWRRLPFLLTHSQTSGKLSRLSLSLRRLVWVSPPFLSGHLPLKDRVLMWLP